MVLRIVSFTLWLLLGLGYVFLYKNTQITCCQQSPVANADPVMLYDTVYHTIVDTMQDGSTELHSSHSSRPIHGVIFFKKNSSQEIDSETFQDFIDQTSQLVIDNNYQIILKGNIDENEWNSGMRQLGLDRANKIKSKFEAHGVNISNIETVDQQHSVPKTTKLNPQSYLDRRVDIIVKSSEWE